MFPSWYLSVTQGDESALITTSKVKSKEMELTTYCKTKELVRQRLLKLTGS